MQSVSTREFRPLVYATLASLLLVVATTLVISVLALLLDAHYLVVLYLAPIVFAMLRFGFAQTLAVVLLSALAAAFFIYEPLYSFWIDDPEEFIELIIFAVLALVIAYLVTVLRDLRRMGPDQLV